MGINKVLGWLKRLVTKFPTEPTKKNYGASGDDNPERMTPGAGRKRQMFRRDPILLFLDYTPLRFAPIFSQGGRVPPENACLRRSDALQGRGYRIREIALRGHRTDDFHISVLHHCFLPRTIAEDRS